MDNIQIDKKAARTLRRWAWLFLIISTISMIAYGLSGLKGRHNPDLPYKIAGEETRDPMSTKVLQVVNGQHLSIPKPYFMNRIPPAGVAKDVLLVVMYPEFEPITKSYNQLWKEGEWYKNIRWMIQDKTDRKNLIEIYESRIKSLQASEFVGIEYGELQHFSQPIGIENDLGDVWVETHLNQIISFIICGKRLTDITVPQCTLYTEKDNLFYNISFDKRLLKEWKNVKGEILSLTQTFLITPDDNKTKGE